MSQSDELDVAHFMLRHFRTEARAAARGIEVEAAASRDAARTDRWLRIGEAIALMQAAGVLDEFGAEAPAPKRRLAACTLQPAARALGSVRTAVPYLRLVVS